MDKTTFDQRVVELTERLQAVQKAIKESGMSVDAQRQGEFIAVDLLVRAAIVDETDKKEQII